MKRKSIRLKKWDYQAHIQNKKVWNIFKKANWSKEMSYSKAPVVTADETMKFLSSDPTPLVNGYYPAKGSAHTLVCEISDKQEGGGLTGFQASFVRDVVAKCHVRGAEFLKSWNNEIGKE